MSFIFHCPHCNQKFDCDDTFDGKQVECPSCKNTFLIKKEKSKNAAIDDYIKKFVDEHKTKETKFAFKESPSGTNIKPQSIKEKVIEVIVTALIVWGSIGGAIALLFFACSPEPKYGGSEPVDYITPGRRHDTTSSGSGSSSLITRSQVIAETRRALDMACSVNGASYSGFTVDDCIISGDKAVCHFSLTEKSMRKTGAIEFNIREGNLIPSGKYYLD